MPTKTKTANDSIFPVWQREREFLEKEKATHPELFLRALQVDDDETLKNVGIDPALFPGRSLGHIKLFPEDFIVEEVTKDNILHTVEDGPLFQETGAKSVEEGKTVWLEAVKMGMDTIQIVEEISKRLGVDKKSMGVAGIKDKHALTSQSISIRNVSPETVALLSAPNFFLKNISQGKGTLQIGELLGNRFTIFIRTEKKVDGRILEEKLGEIREQGFWNFFYLQRFGLPQLISHKLGLLILQGKYEEVVKAALTQFSAREHLYFQNFRKKLIPEWGNWGKLLQMTESLSYTFVDERKMLEYLSAHSGDFAGALNQVPEQVKLWVYAYSSYLFNKVVSQMIREREEVPYSLPLALSFDPRVKEFYDKFFKAHKISFPLRTLKPFPFVQQPRKEIEALKKVTINGVKVIDEGVIIDFFLDKGSYATTFLAHLFILYSGQAIPQGVLVQEIDSKSLLGTGTIQTLKENRFKELFAARKNEDIVVIQR